MHLEGWDESASWTEEDYLRFKVVMEVKKTYEQSGQSIQPLPVPCAYCGNKVDMAFLRLHNRKYLITCLDCYSIARRHNGNKLVFATCQCACCGEARLYNGVVEKNNVKITLCQECFRLMKELAERGIV